MNLEQSFEVQAPIDVVWEALNDLEQIAPCLPGAAITGHDDDGTYHGTFGVKLGPTTASYRGTIKFTEVDQSSYRATMVGKGTDKRGSGGASATIVNTLTEIDGATRVDAVTDFTITGKLARFGRGGMIKDISNRLLGDFATCLQAHLQSAGDTAASASAAASASTQTATEEPAKAQEPAETAGGAAAGSAALVGSPGASPAAPTDETPVESASATTSTDAPAAGTASETPAAAPPSPDVTAPAPATPKPKAAPAQPAASKPISATALVGSVIKDRLASLWPAVRDRLARLLGRGK